MSLFDEINLIDPASIQGPAPLEGLTSLLGAISTFAQQKKAEDKQIEVDKENQRRYDESILYRDERNEILDEQKREQDRYTRGSAIRERAIKNNPNNPFGVYLEASTTDLFSENPSLMRQFGIDKFKTQGEAYNQLQNIATGLGDVSEATISEIQDLQGNERYQGLIKDAGSYGQVVTQQIQDLKKERRALQTSQIETNPEYMALVKSLETDILGPDGLQSDKAQATLTQINNKKLELQNFYSQQGTAATTEQFIPFENLTEAQQQQLKDRGLTSYFPLTTIAGGDGIELADEFEYQGFVRPTTRNTPTVSEIEDGIAGGNLEDVLDGDTTPKRTTQNIGRAGFTEYQLKQMDKQKQITGADLNEVTEKVDSYIQEIFNLENQIKGSNDENEIRILKEELTDVVRNLAIEQSKIVPIRASQALNATNKIIKQIGFTGRSVVDAFIKELFIRQGDEAIGKQPTFSKFTSESTTEKPTEVETSSVGVNPDTTYFTDLKKTIADAKGAPPPIIEDNPREDTTTATEVDKNIGPPAPREIFDSVLNENNKTYSLGLSNRTRNKNKGIAFSTYNLYETSNGVTKNLGPAIETIGGGRKQTRKKQPYQNKNNKHARIILELIKG